MDMEFLRNNLDASEFGSAATMQRLSWLLLILSLVPICIVLPMTSLRIGVATIIAWTALIWIAISFARNQFHNMVLAWLALFPYCYYFLSYPVERSIFTVDRAFSLLLLIELLVVSRYASALPLPHDVRVAGYLWTAYLCVCLVSIWGHSVLDVLGSYRLLVDGMLMPALLGLYAIRRFPVTRNLRKIHACLCILMLGVASVSGTELFTGKNLLPWTGAVEEWVHAATFKIIRVDGPFENSGVLCLVGTLGFFLLIYLRRLIGPSQSRRLSVLHSISTWASLTVALMPMNRGLVIALLVCACMDYFADDSLIAHQTWNYILAGLFVLAITGKLFYPAVFEDRVTRPDNVYQRIAQDLQTLEVVRDHPLIGVGFNLYHDTVLGDAKYTVRLKGFEAMDFPHNSLFAVLAEEGCIGFLLYVAAQVFFVRAMWRLRRLNRLGWRVYLYCVLVYTIYGLDVGMAYYSDLNLFYMFVLGIIFQLQLHMLPSKETFQ
jgi:O-Antigen ligase